MTTTINASTSAGLVTTADTSGILALQTADTTAVTIDASQNVGIGTAALNLSADRTYLAIKGKGTTSSTGLGILQLQTNAAGSTLPNVGNIEWNLPDNTSSSTTRVAYISVGIDGATANNRGASIDFATKSNGVSSSGAVRMTIDSSGNVLVGKTTASSPETVGCELGGTGFGIFTRASDIPLFVNRNTNDGSLVSFRQDNTQEGSISVSGTTVSYNGGHLSRWAQTTAPKDNTLVKGTVLSNLDEMNVYTDTDGNLVENEQLNKVKVSDIEGDVNVAGVFVNWTHDEQHNVDEINMAMTGDMIIRIAQGTAIQRGDLLMSAGDGTAKPQGDDIIRSKTVAKVTSTHVTCTYEDGSYCVPCVLMAC